MSHILPDRSNNGVLVDVYRFWLDRPTHEIARLERLLAPDERDRSARFAFQHHRNRYVVGRGLLRTILAGYGQLSASSIQFAYNAYGKPYLSDRAGVFFNLSNSGPYAVVGVSRDAEIGIDIERIHEFSDFLVLARQFFSPREVQILESMPASEHGSSFFRCWTRKEAFIKAVGQGLSLGLDTFDVEFREGLSPVIRQGTAGVSPWGLAGLRVESNYIGAVAVKGRVGGIRYIEPQPRSV